MQDDAITAKNLSIVRGKNRVLRSLSFSVKKGSLTGLIGPSGSGKTTLIRTVVGAQIITDGRMLVLGKPAGNKDLRGQIGYVTQSPAVYDDLTTRQNVAYFAAILRVPKTEIDRVIEAVDLKLQANQLAGALSGGQRARVSLAVALLGEPPLLVLDEPTVGLDPVLREHLWQLFRRLAASGRTLLISSHVMDEAEMCPELLLVRDGAVLHHGSKQDLLHAAKAKNVHDAFLTLAGGAA
ncbi:MAG TPA: ABC transporter ATP-binding protein [Candidatus Saccharimonadales bacterium]|nr:ABC transporter ATP-binding protein [Candidatus Saccharimonadales bacterium]